MESYFPRGSVIPTATGMVLAWLLAPALAIMVYLAVSAHPDAAQSALPFEFLAIGLLFVGWIFLLVGLFRALKTLDFLGRREHSRMESEGRYIRS